MFHSEGLVSRKGPLGAIWVAAYFVKKLKKAQVKDTNIPSSVDQILQQELDALTYRGLAYLLLGLVRIYSKKVDSLFHDCNTALIGVKEQNRDNTNVPLPAAASTGFPSIALPQCFELDAFDLGLLEDSHGDNVKPQEDITLKHDGVSGRDTESIDHYYMERFDMEEDDLGCTFHVVDDHTDTRHDTAHDMDIDVRDASGEASVREVEAEPLESNKSSRDQQNASRHDRSLPSECKSPEALHGIEELEPGSVVGNGDLPECIEKHRGHSDVEMTDTNMFHTEPSETPQVNKVGYNEKGFLSDMTLSEEPESKGSNAKDAPVAATPKTPSRLKTSQGETSHQFSIINTPGGKESSSRVSRKRKCLIDDEVIIPNKVLKKMIEDSSTLVTKRRKVPHTDYYERRIKRFADPSRSFWDPLFPYGSLDLQLLFCQPIKFKEQNTTETPKAAKTARRMKRSSLRTVESRGDVFPLEQTETGREIMETPQAAGLAELKITVPEMVSASSIAAESAHQTKVAPETPMKPAEPTYIAPETPAVSERVEIAPDTPVRESMSKRYFEDPETCEQETRPSNSFTFFDECPSAFCEDRRDLDAILMNEEQVNAHETEDLQQETWLARTRNVAKFLEKTFLEQREKGEEEKASLLQLCRGRTQKESARLFYETLVLKTKGYLEVKQDHPYSDILLSRFTGQHEAC
ncbi:PREDICTED: sister chromatid cohesion 1 protein 2-like isoform X3 [Brassica oleracea var. oleracea]|uniref:sister chromatid cohesion 1 protein 2-like isoform X3 n=1 Tax=Brassica oleracea var. oleracea TaxID=109376 RepID=UPI0006A6CBE1|nr:PREDICTED: sister chromatid cohesion 1 protein 2-like isoform X3 [Brassica oleracea var. oleracea]